MGGGPAAARCVQELRQQGFDGHLAWVLREERLPYDRTLLSKDYLTGEVSDEALPLLGAADVAGLDVDLHLGRSAVGLHDGMVVLDRGGTVPYDLVVAATGGRPVRPAGFLTPGVHTLRSAAEARGLRAHLDAHPGRDAHVVIVGGGFLGCEVAASLVTTGRRVTLVTGSPGLLSPVVGPEVGELLVALHRAHGVDVRLGGRARQVQRVADRFEVLLRDGSRVRGDLVVVAVGMAAETDWLRGSGVGLDGGVLTDVRCHTARPGVLAAGDCARWWSPRYRSWMRVEHWDVAVQHGAAAARAALGEELVFDPVPYVWSSQYGTRLQWLGHTARCDSVQVERTSRGFVARYLFQGVLAGVLAANEPHAMRTARTEIAAATEVTR